MIGPFLQPRPVKIRISGGSLHIPKFFSLYTCVRAREISHRDRDVHHKWWVDGRHQSLFITLHIFSPHYTQRSKVGLSVAFL